MDIACFLESPDRLPRQYCTARRTTGRRIAEGVGEAEAFAGDAIESGGLHYGIAICAGVSVALIVRNTEEDIGPSASTERESETEACKKKEADGSHGYFSTMRTECQKANSQAQSLGRFSRVRSIFWPANLVRSISISSHSDLTVLKETI